MVTDPLVLIFSHCSSAEHGSMAPFPNRQARPQVHLVPQDTHMSGIMAEPQLPGSGVRREGCSHVAPCWGIMSPPCCACQPAGHRATAMTSAPPRPWPCSQASGQPLLTASAHLLPSCCRPHSASWLVFIKCLLWARPGHLV